MANTIKREESPSAEEPKIEENIYFFSHCNDFLYIEILKIKIKTDKNIMTIFSAVIFFSFCYAPFLETKRFSIGVQ